ncbi:lipase/acyltransferase domain-containing protein [Jidongwangia harbinensis]|uniref:lipase/acyltransferase domain-containing protein n=1 Tax=Jidongwangia harbinensis TaxID=2878561 RepID=UPI001CD9DB01|nr:hypothetical protein [Jidongwangia harbinensis]MCA2215459.1 hypothetical protein [Jidongwangia harbinensis]
MTPSVRRRLTADAVIVVPGVMGSELVDGDGNVQWGLKPALLARAWATHKMATLQVTEDDISGGGRLRPSRLLRVPGHLPMLGGIEPYTALLRRVAEHVLDPRAVLEFAYDWRLSIEHNARLLVPWCEQRLAVWRQLVAENRWADPADVQLTVVAHSMGGLVVRYAIEVLGMSSLVRQVITLGTPYYGAVKAVRMMAAGKGAPVPRRVAQELARTAPGVYDLLPRYRCIDPDRFLSTADVASVGGTAELAEQAEQRWAALRLRPGDPAAAVPVHPLVGAEQPTLQSLRLAGETWSFDESLAGLDHGGDSTVYRNAAAPAGMTAWPLPQKHGALAKTGEALTFVADKLIGADTGPPLGTRPVGADIPDLVQAGAPVEITVTGAGGDPIGVTVACTDLTTNVPTPWTLVRRDGDLLRYTRPGLAPGLYRVQVKAGGFSPVSELVLATDLT